VAVMPAAVACVIDAMVCICVAWYEVLNGRQSFYVFTQECAPKFSFSSSFDGIVIPHFNLVPSSSHSFYTSAKFEFQ
jgi:hypothetical protein